MSWLMAGTWNVAGVATCIHPPLPGRQAHVGFTRNTCKQNQRPSIVGTPLVCVLRLLCASCGSCVRPAALVCVLRLLCASRGLVCVPGACVRPGGWCASRALVRVPVVFGRPGACGASRGLVCVPGACVRPGGLCASRGLVCVPRDGLPNGMVCVLYAAAPPARWTQRDGAPPARWTTQRACVRLAVSRTQRACLHPGSLSASWGRAHPTRMLASCAPIWVLRAALLNVYGPCATRNRLG